MKNYSEYICNKANRQLTAKGNKFLWRCITIVADSKGLNKYSPEMKEPKEKISEIIKHLLIDKELTKDDVIELIKTSQMTEKIFLSN